MVLTLDRKFCMGKIWNYLLELNVDFAQKDGGR